MRNDSAAVSAATNMLLLCFFLSCPAQDGHKLVPTIGQKLGMKLKSPYRRAAATPGGEAIAENSIEK